MNPAVSFNTARKFNECFYFTPSHQNIEHHLKLIKGRSLKPKVVNPSASYLSTGQLTSSTKFLKFCENLSDVIDTMLHDGNQFCNVNNKKKHPSPSNSKTRKLIQPDEQKVLMEFVRILYNFIEAFGRQKSSKEKVEMKKRLLKEYNIFAKSYLEAHNDAVNKSKTYKGSPIENVNQIAYNAKMRIAKSNLLSATKAMDPEIIRMKKFFKIKKTIDKHSLGPFFENTTKYPLKIKPVPKKGSTDVLNPRSRSVLTFWQNNEMNKNKENVGIPVCSISITPPKKAQSSNTIRRFSILKTPAKSLEIDKSNEVSKEQIPDIRPMDMFKEIISDTIRSDAGILDTYVRK